MIHCDPHCDRPRTFKEKPARSVSEIWDALILRLKELLSKNPKLFEPPASSDTAA